MQYKLDFGVFWVRVLAVQVKPPALVRHQRWQMNSAAELLGCRINFIQRNCVAWSHRPDLMPSM